MAPTAGGWTVRTLPIPVAYRIGLNIRQVGEYLKPLT